LINVIKGSVLGKCVKHCDMNVVCTTVKDDNLNNI
jgi:hypothetical protein